MFSNSNYILYFLALILILLLVMCIVCHRLDNIIVKRTHINFPGNQADTTRRNCDVETIYSVDDEQCSAICQETGVFRSYNGKCVNILAFNQEAVHNNCNPKHGVLAYLLGNPELGSTKLFCLSIDEGVQPDDPNKPNTLCTGDGASIDINYVERFPQLSNCKCPDTKFLAQISNTNTIRSRGVCINKTLLPIMEYNNSVFSNNRL